MLAAGLCSILIHTNLAQVLWCALIGSTFITFIPVEEAQLIPARGAAYPTYMQQTPWAPPAWSLVGQSLAWMIERGEPVRLDAALGGAAPLSQQRSQFPSLGLGKPLACLTAHTYNPGRMASLCWYWADSW